MLARINRLMGKRRVPLVLRNGGKQSTRFLYGRFLPYRDNLENPLKVAVVVSSKIHKKAVDRNKLRRQLYELARIFLKEHKDFSKSGELVILPSQQVKTASFLELHADMSRIFSEKLS